MDQRTQDSHGADRGRAEAFDAHDAGVASRMASASHLMPSDPERERGTDKVGAGTQAEASAEGASGDLKGTIIVERLPRGRLALVGRNEAGHVVNSFILSRGEARAVAPELAAGAEAGPSVEEAGPTIEQRVASLEARVALADEGAHRLAALDRAIDREWSGGPAISDRTESDAAHVDEAGADQGEEGAGAAEQAARAAEEARITALLGRTVEAHQIAAERGLGAVARIMTHAAEIAAILAWSPERIEDADRLAAATEAKLAELRACLSSVYTLRQDVHTLGGKVSPPAPDLGEHFGNATARMAELQRRVGGLIRLFETDVFNTVALEAVARQIEEAYVAATVANLGFTLARDRSEIVP